MKKLLWLFSGLLCVLAYGQAPQPIAPITGNITAAGSSCTALVLDSSNSTITNCVSMQLPSTASVVSISLVGTFTATVQFEISANFGNSWIAAPVASAAAAGTYTFGVNGFNGVRARASAYTSGLVITTITPGNGGGNGTVTANSGSAGALATYAATGGSTTVGPDAGLTSNGAGALTTGAVGIGNGSITFKGTTSGSGSLGCTNNTCSGLTMLGALTMSNTGGLNTNRVVIGGTTFTTNAGCGEGALVGGATAGKITTAGQTSCTDIITFVSSATNGYQCTFTDLTTAADAANPHQTATTVNTVTWVSGTIVAADVIQFACIGY